MKLRDTYRLQPICVQVFSLSVKTFLEPHDLTISQVSSDPPTYLDVSLLE